ncbi:hypothetical protein D9756_006406 [Leucocoprinus leucothites]|uniref:ferric-chelate reductase (NADPH) n=1 Tax=Leucocoprinus leucothites TaxID=201217 RepID=A0A8H5G233_9AGAR|nr:hypothetical protein D9756_006406 [Leucoagaricus leucothites]
MADLPPFSVTNCPATKVDITVGSQTPDADRVIRISHAEQYPLQVWYFLTAFIFLVTLANVVGLGLGYYRDRRRRQELGQAWTDADADAEPSIRRPREEMRGSINILRLPHATVDTFRALSFRWTVSIGRSYTLNIAEVVLTAVYIVICFTWSLINTTSTKGVKFDPHYYANIAGNIATIQFPLIVALGMKNNIISYLTGVSFDKLIYLHGMVSRVLVVLIWLHAGGRAQLGLVGKVAVTVPVIQAGILAGVALTLLSVVSIRPIRDKAYEFFLIVHLVLGVICVLAAYFHAASLDFGHFLWPSILLWGLDRVLRLLRIALSRIKKKAATPTSASVESKELSVHASAGVKPKLDFLSEHFILLTTPIPRFLHWRPGQSVYLSFPGVSLSPFEAHPFTIATIPATSTESDSGNQVQASTGKLKFFMRVRSGVTRRLLSHIETGKQLRVYFDGPYSSPPVLMGYDSVVLIAGGSGIAFTLPLFLDLVQRTKKSGPVCRRLTFTWTIRHVDNMSWIQSEISDALQNLPNNMILNLHIFVTGSAEAKAQSSLSASQEEELDDDDEKFDEHVNEIGAVENRGGVGSGGSGNTPRDGGISPVSPEGQNILASPMVQIHHGRVDLDKMLKDEIALARDTMSVSVCGTLTLAKTVRKALRYPRFVDILKGGPTVSLHVEAFGSGPVNENRPPPHFPPPLPRFPQWLDDQGLELSLHRFRDERFVV